MKAVLAVQLLQMLVLWMITCCTSALAMLTMLHVPGNLNCMADFASQWFAQCTSSCDFLTAFYDHFKLPQNSCWLLFQLLSAMIGCVLVNLSMKTLSLLLWHPQTKCMSITGSTGISSFQLVSICTFIDWINQNNSFSYMFLLNKLEKVPLAEDGKSKPIVSRQLLVSLARLSNWLASQTLSTRQALQTTMQR